MNEEIKNKLRNAGFEAIKDTRLDWSIMKKTPLYKIYINPNNNHVAIDNNNDALVFEGVPFENLEELNKICYPFNGLKDLTFDGKQYTWEECLGREKGWYVDEFSTIDYTTEIIVDEDHRNVCPTEDNAISIGATTQLMQICKKINEDFPSYGHHSHYPVLSKDGTFDWTCFDLKINQFPMNSEEAVKKLIETNSDLLYQYFETEKP